MDYKHTPNFQLCALISPHINVRNMFNLTCRKSKLRSCLLCVAIYAIINVFLLSTVSWWLSPTPEQWLPYFMKPANRDRGVFVQTFTSTRTNLNRTLKILLWSPLFGDPNWAEDSLSEAFSSCPVSKCVLSNDKSDIVTSDAVLFHAMDLWNKFLGYSLPQNRTSNQVWILYNFEPPPQCPMNFNSYPGVFNWTGSYRKDSDVFIAPFKLERLSRRDISIQDVASTKSAGIAWVASNCADDSRRQMLVREINKYFPVDSYGHCGDRTLPKKDMDSVLRKYKFYLSFENSYCRDYITEKFSDTLHRHLVPIVAGGGDYKTAAPPHSYIDIKEFNSIRDLADCLRYLDQNDTAYNSYFDWTGKYRLTHPHHWCQLCEALHDERRPFQVYTDLAGYIEDDTCPRWTLSGYIYRNIQGYAIKYGLI